MKLLKIFILFSTVLFLTACVPRDSNVTSEQSIQDIVSDQTNYDDIVDTTTTETTQNASNETVITAPVVDPNEKPLFSKKCRTAAIVYGGCKWTSNELITFDLKIGSKSYTNIPGVWFDIEGESGGIKYVKRTEKLLAGGIRTYNINYDDLVKELGRINRFEVYSIEVMNGTEYACQNQLFRFIPDTHCKNAEPINVDYRGNPIIE